jgi:hypothetical protein
MLSACGASKGSSNEYDQSSRLNVTDVTTIDTSTRPLAYCNESTNDHIAYATSTYQDGETIDTNRINLKILKIPAYFSQSQNYIEFKKYMVNPAGSKLEGKTRLSFNIYSIADRSLLAAGKEFLLWADLHAAAQKVGAATPELFFKKVRLVVELIDPNAEYDAISVQYFNHSDDTLVSKLDGLIPAFDADPNRYAIERDGQKRHISLQNLHPFNSSKLAGWSALTYQTKAYEFCKPIYTVQ